jgi:hypothetical protein
MDAYSISAVPFHNVEMSSGPSAPASDALAGARAPDQIGVGSAPDIHAALQSGLLYSVLSLRNGCTGNHPAAAVKSFHAQLQRILFDSDDSTSAAAAAAAVSDADSERERKLCVMQIGLRAAQDCVYGVRAAGFASEDRAVSHSKPVINALRSWTKELGLTLMRNTPAAAETASSATTAGYRA